MNTPMFSIVVPCCDVAACVGETAESLLAQSCGDFECLLMVETSCDETLSVCRRLSAADPRFRLYTQPRSGSPSAPRNTGMAAAVGEYIVWLDGDDWLEPEALAEIKKVIVETDRPDVVQGAAAEVVENRDGGFAVNRRIFNYLPGDGGRVFSGREALIHLARLHMNPFPAVWLSICRREFLLRGDLKFVPGLLFEDEEWTPRVIYSASRVAVMDFTFYNYRKRKNSITATERDDELRHHAAIVKSLLEFHAGHPFDPELSRAWGRNLLSLFYCRFFFPKYAGRHSGKERKALIRAVLSNPDAFRKLVRNASLPRKTAAFFVLTARWSLTPGDLFFRYIYYPLAARNRRRR